MSVSAGLGNPSSSRTTGLPRPVFFDGLPNTSGGKKSLPQKWRFTLPYLWAAEVSLIVHDSIPGNTPCIVSSRNI